MEDRQIEDLIAEVRSLRIQVDRLETELHRRNSSSQPQAVTPTTQRQPVLRGATGPSHSYAVGDRVYILNKIKKPAIWDSRRVWNEGEARNATVTEVRPTQIFFVTDNGVETWRAPNNLRKI